MTYATVAVKSVIKGKLAVYQNPVKNNLNFSLPNGEKISHITISILWWRKQGKLEELKKCYDYTKEIIKKLSNPVPKGQTKEQFFGENYEVASQDPNVYGWMQFTQFIKIYEDESLPDFDTFVSYYMKKKKK